MVFAVFYKQNVLLSSDRQGQKVFHEKYECKAKSVFCYWIHVLIGINEIVLTRKHVGLITVHGDKVESRYG